MASIDDEAATARRRERVVLLCLAAVQFTSIVDFMIVMPLGPQLMRTLDIASDKFGLIVSSYTFSAAVAGLLAALVVDRFGRKSAFLTVYSGFLAGTLMCGLAQTYGTLLAARVLTGAFGGVLGGMAMAIIGDVFPRERHGAATGALMSAFSLASVVGVPLGLKLGTTYNWHVPFFFLVGVGSLVLPLAIWGMPPLRGHLDRGRPAGNPAAEIWATVTHPNHLRAFALIVALMLGSFTVIPYINPYLVQNVGVAESNLFWVYLLGGALTLVASPAVGKLADRHGKLRVYRVVAPIGAATMILVTTLPRVPTALAVSAVALLIVGNASRMVAALAIVMAGVESRRRGSFMSVNSSVQHMATGLGAYLGGLIVVGGKDGPLSNFSTVGVLAACATLGSIALAARIRPVGAPAPSSAGLSLAAASDAIDGPGEAIAAVEMI